MSSRDALPRLILLASLLLPGTLAHADWKTLVAASGKAPEIAYDPDRNMHEPPYRTTWTRIVLLAPGKLSDGTVYLSALEKVAVQCAERTWAVTYSEFYSKRDATGLLVSTYSLPRQEWTFKKAKPGSTGDKLARALCDADK